MTNGSVQPGDGLVSDAAAHRPADTRLPSLAGIDAGLRTLVVGAISNSIVIADATAPDQPIQYVNPAFERATGYRADEVVGRNCRFLQGPGTDRTAVATMREAIAEGRGCTVTVLNYRKDGTPFWQELSISPVRDRQGTLVHFVGVQTDLTARKRAEEREQAEAAERLAGVEQALRLAEEAQRLTEAAKQLTEDARQLAEERLRLAEERRRLADEARGQAERQHASAEASMHVRNEALVTVTHDLRSPLTSIRGRLDLIQSRLGGGKALDPTWIAKQIGAIHAASLRIGATVDEMMDLAQLWVGQPLILRLEALDLGALVRGVVATDDSTTARGNVQVDAPDGFVIVGDRTRLERAIQNLIDNAVKYSSGTPVAVTVRQSPNGDGPMVTVCDQGVGIPASDLPHIFTRFYRASTARGVAGTGIGLAGAKSIVEQHGGTIELESTKGEGTMVTVRLPRTVPTSAVPLTAGEDA